MEMEDFKNRFGNTVNARGERAWTPWINGVVVCLLSAGAIIGAAFGAPYVQQREMGC